MRWRRRPVDDGGSGPLCLDCADLGHLVFLPSGDDALTRRARKASGLSAVVVRFSRARRRYERQGILVEEEALEQAETECLADADARARRRERERLRRAEQDLAFQAEMAAEILRLFPGCPRVRAEEIARHAGARDSGRVGRSPLGVTAEIAEYEVARILKLKLSSARQSGYDAVREVDGESELLQIKGRRLTPTSKASQRVGSINLEKEWDVVILVLLDEHYEPTEIYEAGRKAVTAALAKPGSKARNERGSLAVSQFKAIGSRIWPS